jgi:hypothetical protein
MQIKAGNDGEEAKWSGKTRKEALGPRHSGGGDKTMGICGRWPLTAYGHHSITARDVTRVRVTGAAD